MDESLTSETKKYSNIILYAIVIVLIVALMAGFLFIMSKLDKQNKYIIEVKERILNIEKEIAENKVKSEETYEKLQEYRLDLAKKGMFVDPTIKIVSTTQNIQSQFANQTSHIEVETISVADCGQNAECFEEKLKQCEKANLVSKIVDLNISVLYEILNKQNGKCQVSFTYLNYIDEWENKPMVCLYDPSKGIEQNEEIFNSILKGDNFAQCQGDLVNLLKTGPSN